MGNTIKQVPPRDLTTAEIKEAARNSLAVQAREKQLLTALAAVSRSAFEGAAIRMQCAPGVHFELTIFGDMSASNLRRVASLLNVQADVLADTPPVMETLASECTKHREADQ